MNRYKIYKMKYHEKVLDFPYGSKFDRDDIDIR